MKHGLRMVTAGGLLLASLFVSPLAAMAGERGPTISEPAVADPIWNALGQAVVDFERAIGHADGAPEQ